MIQLLSSPLSSPALSHSSISTMGGSQASLSLSATDTFIEPKSPSAPKRLKTSDRFFMNDNMIEFRVEDTRYRVPRYYFDQYSKDFAITYKLPATTCSDNTPYVHLDDVTTRDFEQLLSIFYPSTLASPYPDTKTVEEWTSVLRLATKFKFLSLRELAVERLFDITSPLDKVFLAHTFELPEWLPEAYAQICARDRPLTVEEGRRLGELGPVGNDIIIRFWQTCHEMRSTPSPMLPVADIVAIVKRIFELDHSQSETSFVHENADADHVINSPVVSPKIPAGADLPINSPLVSPRIHTDADMVMDLPVPTNADTAISPPVEALTIPTYLRDWQESSPRISPATPSAPLPLAMATPLSFGYEAFPLHETTGGLAEIAPTKMSKKKLRKAKWQVKAEEKTEQQEYLETNVQFGARDWATDSLIQLPSKRASAFSFSFE